MEVQLPVLTFLIAMARAHGVQSVRTGDGETAEMPLLIGMRSEGTWDWRASLQDGLITIIPPPARPSTSTRRMAPTRRFLPVFPASAISACSSRRPTSPPARMEALLSSCSWTTPASACAFRWRRAMLLPSSPLPANSRPPLSGRSRSRRSATGTATSRSVTPSWKV